MRAWLERWLMGGLLGVAGLCLGLAVWTAPAGAQSTATAPAVREVNSHLMHNLLDAIENLLDTIQTSLATDATHDAAAQGTGPQLMGECDATSTDAVDEGDAGKLRINCSTRALVVETVDPCARAKTYHIVNMATATTVEIANAVASEYFHICAVNLVAAGAQTIAIGEDDTDGCGSITAGLHGGATAATGWSLAANGVLMLGNGLGTVMKTATAARYLCVITGAAQQISGTIAYVSAP